MNHSETKKLVVTTGVPSTNVFAERVSLVNEAGQQISTKTDAELNSRYAPSSQTALAPWFRALAGRHAAAANAVVVGDSVDIAFAPSTHNKLWVRRCQAQLRSALPTDGTLGPGRGFIGPTATSAGARFTWPGTVSGGSSVSGFGPNIDAYQLVSGQTITFTLNGTHADIVYSGGPSTSTISATVDGGGAVTQSTVVSPITHGRLFRVSLGASGAHTLVITATSATAIFIGGVIEYDADQDVGIHVHGLGNSGDTATTWATALAGTDTGQAIAKAFNPDLIIVKLGINDRVNAGVSAATFAAQLELTISRLVTFCSTNNSGKRPPTLILGSYEVTSANSSTWAEFIAAMATVAAAAPTERVFLDLSSRMPTVAAGPSGFYYDAYHAGDWGHAMMADAVTRFLLPI